MKAFVTLFVFCFTVTLNAGISVSSLTIEGLTNPYGIDERQPRLSWIISAPQAQGVMQRAYQILVASSEEMLARNQADVWNSGKVRSRQSIHIPYGGPKLKSNGAYFWKVRVWTNRGVADWSPTNRWTMGLLYDREWQARWIGLDRAMPWDSETQWSRLSARYLRKEFELKKNIRRASVHIAGLGLYELFFNGKRVGNQVLAPAPTDYRKSILYNSYEVTELLQKGNNAVGVTLGNGRYYTMRQNFKPHKINTFGFPKLRLALVVEYTDGSTETIGSTETWKLTADGPIRSNNEYDGEEYDARKELTGWNKVGYNDAEWMQAQRVTIPLVDLRAQRMPGMKVLKEITPISIRRIGEKYIFDMGQNMTGWMRIHVRGKAGDSIVMRFAEILKDDGTLFMANLRDAKVTNVYVLKGDPAGESWAPRFVYHGFRYVEITGLQTTPDPKHFVGEFVADALPSTGSFQSSNSVLNTVMRNAWWGILGNYKGMPVDCPQRNERQPWLGDRTMGVWGESYLFDVRSMYTKWGRDIVEAQRPDGSIPDVAPAFWNYYSDNVTWPAALPMLCDMLYTQYGDLRPIEENYPAIKKWMNHMESNYLSSSFLMTKDQYGDWCVPPESPELIHSRDPRRRTDGTLISTAYYYKLLQLMAKFARLQDLRQDARQFETLAKKMKVSFNERFFRTDSLFYGNNSATSNLLPLAFGMIPPKYVDTVVQHIVRAKIPINTRSQIGTGNFGITTGVIGTQWLMRTLSRMGRADVAFALAVNDKYPSWGYMAANGATTIWELWNGNTANPAMNSGNHVMLLGDLIPWAYENLAGIRSAPGSVAFNRIVMKPQFNIEDLEWIKATYHTPYGAVVSHWRKNLMQLHWEVEIPVNTMAEIHLPNGKKLKRGSGKYTFQVALPQRKGVVTSQFIYEKAPFPQCHSATLVETSQGDLLAAFFGGTREGHPDVSIYLSKKLKGSSKWTEPQKVAEGWQPDGTRKACYNPVLFENSNGTVSLFYKVGSRVSDWKGFVIHSSDGGHSWSQPIALPAGFLGPVKNKPLRLTNGKVLAPSSTEQDGWRVHFEILDDSGKPIRKVGPLTATRSVPTHLRKSETALDVPDAEGGDHTISATVQAIQPSILVHGNGRLQMLCRTRNGKVGTAWSEDDGETWSPIELANLPNNNSATDAITLSDGRHVIVYNAVATPDGERKGLRTPLNVAVSRDGIRWRMVKTLEDSPLSQYSYPSIIQGRDGRIHIVYTWRRQRLKYIELKL